MYENLRKIEKVRQRFRAGTGREAKVGEIATLAELPAITVRNVLRIPDQPISLEEGLHEIEAIPDDKSLSPEDICHSIALRHHIRILLAGLDPRAAEVIRQRFGIDRDEHTLEEVGQMYGVTRERIRQIEAKALRVLKNPSRSGHLWGSV
jgi:RNA polymerase primary sigma factor